MKTLYEQIDCHCVHFNGLQNATCDGGVDYQSVRDKAQARRAQYPCWRDGATLPCDQRHFPTPEEVAAEVRSIEESSQRSLVAMRAAHEDAKQHGYGKGHGGIGEIVCPVCATGVLRYSVAGYNGHIHGRCETTDCVAWME